MDDLGVTMLGMAKKSQSRKTGEPQRRRPNYPIFVRVEPALGQALEAFIDRTRPKTTQTAVVALALEEFLTRAGLWPPTEEQATS